MEMNVARSESVVPVTAWSSLQVHRHRRGADERGERIGDADHLELVLAGGAQGAADVEGVPTSTPSWSAVRSSMTISWDIGPA